MPELVSGRRIYELCALGDQLINESLALIYPDSKISKGIAFPTCISVNECVGHYSPNSDDMKVLNEGDLVKMCVKKPVK